MCFTSSVTLGRIVSKRVRRNSLTIRHVGMAYANVTRTSATLAVTSAVSIA